MCGRCAPKKDPHFYLKKKALPIWIRKRDGAPVYTLPPELSGLTIAEKLLIQRASPFVPLSHIKNGVFGLCGHVCSFEQTVDELFNRLPRSKDDVELLQVVQTMRAEIGSLDSTTKNIWMVRKRKIQKALIWLKANNVEHADIEIDMSRLDWIDGDKASIDFGELEVPDIQTRADDKHDNSDLGPAPRQCFDPSKESEHVTACGRVDEKCPNVLSPNDTTINTELQAAVQKSPNRKKISMDWPTVSQTPVSEHGNKKIFCLAFPWLFPGGLGDVKDFPGNIGHWGEMMLRYEDGRFARDKAFCFYAMNYISRQRNNTSGKFFVDKFHSGCPETLDDLKQQMLGGDTSFINHLTFYNHRVKGSTPHWLKKRSELYSWINHHVDSGNGAPMFFITLSCAEHHWKDIIRLIKDRLNIAGLDSTECYAGSPKLAQYLNDYSIVVQEFFQKRVEVWLETVGKDVFDIKHYWVRYEFAPGRGQIHAHLLAITNDQATYEVCYQDLKRDRTGTNRAARLAEYMESKIGLTATTNMSFDELHVTSDNTPCTMNFSDVPDTPTAKKDDLQKLMKFCMCHECSDFCLKNNSNR